MSTPFKMKGFPQHAGVTPLKKNQIPPKLGESYKDYLKRGFKESKDPYGKDVMSRKPFDKISRSTDVVDQATGKRYSESQLKKMVSQQEKARLTKFKNIGKKVLKVGGRIAGAAGLAGMAYEAYKSGQKHSGGKAGSKEGQAKWKADKEKGKAAWEAAKNKAKKK